MNENTMELTYNVNQGPSQTPLQNQAGEGAGTLESRSLQSLSTYSENKTAQQQRLERINQIGKTQQSNSEFQAPIQLPNTLPSPVQELVLNRFQNKRLSSDTQESMSSFVLSQNKLRKLDNEREREQLKLFSKLQDTNLDKLYEQLKQAENQQKEFAQQAQAYQNDKFQQDATEQIQYLEEQLEKVMSSLKNTMSFIHEKITNLQATTKEIFAWYFTNSQQDIHRVQQVLQKQDGSLAKAIQSLTSTDEAVDLLLSKVEYIATQSNQADSDKALAVCQQILQYFKSQIQVVYEHVKFNRDEQRQQLSLIQNSVASQFTVLKSENETYKQTILQQQSQIDAINKSLQQIATHMTNVEKMAKVSYFGTNLLIDNDELLKNGLSETTSKQAHLLDLVAQMTNLSFQQNEQKDKQGIIKHFQDSVQSLQLNKKTKLDFPNIQKIPEFMGYDHTVQNERMEVEERVYDENRTSYNKNVDEFFKRYPRNQMQFMVDNPNQPDVKQQQPSLLDQINDALNQNPLPKPSKQNSDPILHKKGSDVGSVKLAQQQQPRDAFHYDQFLEALKPTTTAPRYAPVERHYHKFQFNQKFDRKTHPKIFLLQFETLADQCGLTDKEKCLQLMFALQGEYLDWYTARYLNSSTELTWNQLRTLFLETFTKSDDEARDDLYRVTQRTNESLFDFLNRLRNTVNTSNLNDDHIKSQFCSGLQNQKAKQYIYNMKQFNFSLYKKHTTTTLLQELEKQSRIFNIELQNRSVDRTQKQYNSNRNTRRPIYKSNYVPKTNNDNKEQKLSTFKPKYPTKQNKQVNFVEDTKEDDQSKLDPLAQYEEEDESLQSEDHDEHSDQSSDKDRQHQDVSNMLIAGPQIPTNLAQINNLQQQHEIQAGEGEQVHSLFRANQKNAQNFTDKLVELNSKGRKLPKIDYKMVRSSTYIHMPDEQLLAESPNQFINACNYLFECLDNESNLLNTSETSSQFKKLLETLITRMQAIKSNTLTTSNNTQIELVNNIDSSQNTHKFVNESYNAVIKINPIDFLCFITIKFEGKDITALVDTGSTVTVVSDNFCKKNKIKIPQCDTKREVTLADGSTTEMLEWKNAKITLDKYNNIYGDVLISKSKSYDMLFGLNACLAIGASLTSDFLRYYLIVDGKERFGKLLVSKKTKSDLSKTFA